MSLKPYPQYKPSNVAWLGDVPEHWDVKRLKEVCNVFPSNVDKKSYDDQIPIRLCNYTDVYYNEKITVDMELMAATASLEQIEKFTLKAGDVIITKDSESANDIAIPAYVPNDMPNVVCGYHLSMVRTKNNNVGLFIKRLFDGHYLKASFEVLANGLTRVGLGQYAIDNVVIPLPPSEEQTTIANFLDHETSKIDALIAEQQKLITLLAEKRQATISHAVTKGLNPNVPMKDSGVEWLGDVPEHWDLKRLKYLCTVQTGDKDTVDAVSEGLYPFFVRSQTIESINSFTFDCEAVLTAGDGVGVGKVFHHIVGKFDFHQRVYMMNKFIAISGRFFFHYLATLFHKVALDGNAKSTVDSLRMPLFLNFKITVPPLTEQTQILDFVESKLAYFDELSKEANCSIDLLKERRTALISAAVTGKIDVRGFSATINN